MLLTAAREAIVTTCLELSRAGLVVGTAGNVSVRDGDLVAVTPSGVRYVTLTPDMVGVHRLDGSPVEAPLGPTSEMALHLAVYAARRGPAGQRPATDGDTARTTDSTFLELTESFLPGRCPSCSEQSIRNFRSLTDIFRGCNAQIFLYHSIAGV